MTKDKKQIQKVILENYIKLKTPILFEEEIKEIFTITNPEYLSICNLRGIQASKRPKKYILSRCKVGRRWTTIKIPEKLFYWKYDKSGYLLIPRGALFELEKFYKKTKTSYKVINKRKTKAPFNLTFHGELQPQKGQLAIQKLKKENAIVQAPTGSGKTVMFLWKIAQLGYPTIIVVDTLELLRQWTERIVEFLHIKKQNIGQLGDGVVRPKNITVASVKTLIKHTYILDKFGICGIDECHIAATDTYQIVINYFYGKFVFGLSATPRRSDGKTLVMKWLLGNIETRIKYENAERTPCNIKFLSTEYDCETSFYSQYSASLRSLTENKDRNVLIKDNMLDTIEIFGIHLILSHSSLHLEYIYDLLPPHVQLISKILIGPVNKKERINIVSLMKENKLKYVFSTWQLLGKGFDEPYLSVIHLVSPIKVKTADGGNLAQFIGRITRIHPDKKQSWIFDYWDKHIRLLKTFTKTRSTLYKKLGIQRIK